MKRLLDDIKAYSISTNVPIITDNTKSFIKDILYSHKPTNCLEIGAGIGYSTIFIADIISKRNGMISSFEIGQSSYKHALFNIQSSKLFNINLYNMDFLQVPLKKIIKQKVDFVFIDAMKSAYLSYYKYVKSILSFNCVLIFDDVIKFDYRMKNLYTFLGKNQINFKVFKLDSDDGILMIKNNDKAFK